MRKSGNTKSSTACYSDCQRCYRASFAQAVCNEWLDQLTRLSYTIGYSLPPARPQTVALFIYRLMERNPMADNERVDTESSLVTIPQQRAVEVPSALPVRLQTLDLARHVVTAPDGKRYVVASFDDTRLGHGYMTVVYPQQNGYLTLVRLAAFETSSETPEQAMQRHVEVAQSVQQGKLNKIAKAKSKYLQRSRRDSNKAHIALDRSPVNPYT